MTVISTVQEFVNSIKVTNETLTAFSTKVKSKYIYMHVINFSIYHFRDYFFSAFYIYIVNKIFSGKPKIFYEVHVKLCLWISSQIISMYLNKQTITEYIYDFE